MDRVQGKMKGRARWREEGGEREGKGVLFYSKMPQMEIVDSVSI